MSEVKLKFQADITDSSRGVAKFIRDMTAADNEIKKVAGSARKMKGAVKGAMDGAGRSASDAKNKVKTVKTEMSKTASIAGKTASQIAAWVGGFAGIAGVASAIRQIYKEMKEADQTRRGMLSTAVELETEAMKIAHLRSSQDAKRSDILSVQADMAEIAKKAHVPLDVAASAMFFSESTFGAATPEAKSAAMAITEFAAPAQLTAEEVKMIPKLFSVAGAKTKKEQTQVLNQLLQATGKSISEVGEYLQPFISTTVSDIERGYTLSQSLARMTTMIETTGGIAEAASMSKRVVDVSAGRNEKALKFLAAEAAARDIKFSAMSDPEREQFAGRLYSEYKAAGRMDELKTELDTKGFAALRARWSDTARQKYAEALPVIEAARDSNKVQEMATDYGTTLKAFDIDLKTNKTLIEAKTGRELKSQAYTAEIAEAVSQQQHAGLKTGMEYFTYSLWGMNSRRVKSLLLENLGGAMRKHKKEFPEDEAGYEKLKKVYVDTVDDFGHPGPDTINKAWDATKGLTTFDRTGNYDDVSWQMRGMMRYYDTGTAEGEEGGLTGAAEKLNQSATQMTEAAGKISEAAEKITRGIPTGLFMGGGG